MKRSTRQVALLRAIGVVAAVAIIVSGVTFAALQSQQDTLTGNTIETATANLQLSTDGTAYADSYAGFDFNNIVPGGQAVPTTGYPFYLKNSGGTPLSLKMAVSSTPANPNSVDLSKVNVILTPVATGTSAQTFTLQSLITGFLEAACQSPAVTWPAGLPNNTNCRFLWLLTRLAAPAPVSATLTLVSAARLSAIRWHLMSSRARQFVHIAFITTLTLPIAGAVGLIILHARGERLLSVQTASMVPTFRPGDAILIQPVSPSSLRPGDIVSYRSPLNPHLFISHRLVRIDRQTGQLITAGDALHTPDQPFSQLQVVGRPQP